MDIDHSELDANLSCIRLAGRLDAAGAESIDQRFGAAAVAPGRKVLVDLSGVSFVASMGIRLLIAGARGLQAQGGAMALFGAQPPVHAVLDQAALDQIIPIAATQAEALARLAD